jgi:hypothetical protein
VQYVFRPVGQNEQRVYGVFESLECSQDQITVVVRTTEGVLRARAARFSDVQFITYRQLAALKVACGKQSPLYEVYLTSREGAAAGGDRTAVAVEILPEGFIP